MKKQLEYFYAMQLQMFICNETTGDFFMFASEKPDDYFLITIEYDKPLEITTKGSVDKI